MTSKLCTEIRTEYPTVDTSMMCHKLACLHVPGFTRASIRMMDLHTKMQRTYCKCTASGSDNKCEFSLAEINAFSACCVGGKWDVQRHCNAQQPVCWRRATGITNSPPRVMLAKVSKVIVPSSSSSRSAAN